MQHVEGKQGARESWILLQAPQPLVCGPFYQSLVPEPANRKSAGHLFTVALAPRHDLRLYLFPRT
ncbi:hypothetical protein NOI87_30080, partial [Neorhizobium galegae]|uniref:hypothetical protein n=1 Tax=Neorhizobium galegae TaxID=399 RepID=UPI002105E0A8